MNRKNVWFVIISYKPDNTVLQRLIATIKGRPMEVVDNTQKNFGYGGGANVGMKRAFDAGATWVIICNQDIRLTKAGIAKFAKALELGEPGIVGPEAGELDPKRWTTIVPSRGPVDYISGSLMAIHRDVYEATGGFYETYVMYYEDVDLCVRAKRLGFPLWQVGVEGFRHDSGKSVGKEYYLARNHLLFVFRNAPAAVKLRELARLPKTLWEYFL